MATLNGVPLGDGTPIVVSRNRFDDIAPYMGKLYVEDPARYGSIFPWEYPHNVSREQEQKFLIDWFGEREVGVQGGEPSGFRFLRQVWLCCALWNLNHKVPAIVDWWFAQKDNQDVLNGAEFYESACAPNITPDAFFPNGVLKECGEKSLHLAMDFIQQRIRNIASQKKQEEETLTICDTNDEDSIAKSTALNDLPIAGVGITSPPSDSTPRSAAVQLDQDQKSGLDAMTARPNVPISLPETSGFADFQATSSQPAAATGHNIRISGDVRNQLPQHSRGRQRGFSNSGRAYMRTNQRPQTQQQPYFDRNQQYQPAFNAAYPNHGNPPSYPMRDPMRMSSGPPVQFNQPPPQLFPGHPLPPAHFNTGMPQQHYVQHAPFSTYQQAPLPQPIYLPNSQMQQPGYPGQFALNDRSNEVFDGRDFSHEHPSFMGTEAYNKRGARRDSNTSRGGRARGHTNGSGRGRGGRVRNEFSAEFHDSFGFNGQQSIRNMSSDYGMPAELLHGKMDRRASMASDWRNREQPTPSQSNENNRPDRQSFSSADYSTQSIPPEQAADHRGHMQHAFRSMSGSMNAPHVLDFMPIHDPLSEPASANPHQILTRDHIGAGCTHVNKLVLFDQTKQVTEFMIREHFGTYSKVIAVARNMTKGPHEGTSDMFWLTFTDNIEAQKALDLGMPKWQGSPIKVDVPRQFWDPKRNNYPGFIQAAVKQEMTILTKQPSPPRRTDDPSEIGTGIAEQPVPSGDSTPIAKDSVVDDNRKQMLSGDTTPTPSATNTPKKPAKRKPKKSTKSQDKDVPEKLRNVVESAQAITDRSEPEAHEASTVPTSEAATPVARCLDQTNDKSSVAHGDAPAEMLPVDNQRKVSATSSEDAQTKSETAFSPEVEVKAVLPPFERGDNGAPAPLVSTPESVKDAKNETHDMTSSEPLVENVMKDPPAAEVPLSITNAEMVDGDAASSEAKVAGSIKADPAMNAAVSVDAQAEFANSQTAAASDPTADECANEAQSVTLDARLSVPKPEDDQGDESFHTATSSPDVHKDAAKKDNDGSEDSSDTCKTVGEVIFTPTSSDGSAKMLQQATTDDVVEEARSDSIVEAQVTDTPALPISPSTKRDVKKAPVPQVPLTVKVVKNVKAQSEDVPKTGSDALRSASSLTVPPTPAFHTAPSTPASPPAPSCETSAAEESRKPSAQQSFDSVTKEPAKPTSQAKKVEKVEKVEKSKGPSQTESLNPFAKQAKKKVKTPKKGTLKGKPKAEELADESNSRAVSGAADPNTPSDEPSTTAKSIDASLSLGAAKTEKKTQMVKATPAPTDVGLEANDKASEGKVSLTSARSLSPSKTVTTIGNFMKGIFGTNQASASVPTETTGDQESSKAVLTDQKTKDDGANAMAPAIVQPPSQPDKAMGAAAAVAPAPSIASASNHLQSPFQPVPESHDLGGLHHGGDGVGSNTRNDVDHGLGISTSDKTTVTEEAPKAKKKKPKKKKKKAKKNDENDDGAEDAADDIVEDEATASGLQTNDAEASASPFTFEFKAGNTPKASDKVSEASSHTMTGDEMPVSPTTPSTQDPSPAKRMIEAQNQKKATHNLVEAKPFSRKQPRRVSSTPKTAATTAEDGKSEGTESGESGKIEETEGFMETLKEKMPGLVEKVVKQRAGKNDENARPVGQASAGAQGKP